MNAITNEIAKRLNLTAAQAVIFPSVVTRAAASAGVPIAKMIEMVETCAELRNYLRSVAIQVSP